MPRLEPPMAPLQLAGVLLVPMVMMQNLMKAVEKRRTTMARHHSRSLLRRMERMERMETLDRMKREPVQPVQPPVQPVITEAQRILRFVMGGESSAPRTLAPLPTVQRAIPLGPQQSVLQAIPLDPQDIVARTATTLTATTQPSVVRTVVSDPSGARITVPEPSSRQTRAQTQIQPASARGTEERRGKKSKKSKK
ncbi:hypothetical protein R1sor_000912 [Riccia sorocarpa]|uniref:Uncharacterized protein n=1 Tax=Riccia sorocarpa TaxID=122646 RepID=A0ABD3GUG6_9MARC